MAKLNGFDKIAVWYDLLACIVFGKSIMDAQKCFIYNIPAQAKILILGGGTGRLLAEVLSAKPHCEVWYIEASMKMIELSRQKGFSNDQVHFIHGTEKEIPTNIFFDVVITNFYLDLFQSKDLHNVIVHISLSLKSEALWLVTDFVKNGKTWQVFMLKIMYTFFRLCCNIEASSLPDWQKALRQKKFYSIMSRQFYNGFIMSDLYRWKQILL